MTDPKPKASKKDISDTMPDVRVNPPPDGFETWEQCRDYYALEALFWGMYLDRHPGPRNEKKYLAMARLATEANRNCAEPYPE